MTTIAFDGNTLASDSQSSAGNLVISMREKKIFTGDGWSVNGKPVIAVACAGDCGIEEELFNVMTVGLDFMTDFSPHIDFTALLVTGKDESYVIWKEKDSTRAPIMFQRGPIAIGSGDVIATTAMHLGKTAVEAVQVAIELDKSTGGTVDSVVI